MAEETVPASTTPAATLQVNMPTEMVLRHQTDPWTEAQAQQQASDSRVIRAACLLKKLANEQKIKELEPLIQAKAIELVELERQLNEGARTIIGDMKLSDVFGEVKKALKVLKIHSIVCSIDLQELDIEAGYISFTRKIGEDKRGYGATMSGSDQVKFPQEMKDLRKQWLALRDDIKELEAELMKAKVALQDRANTQADAEGLVALQNLNQDEAEKTKQVFERMGHNTTVAGLLGGKV